jgi:hypothetical protein
MQKVSQLTGFNVRYNISFIDPPLKGIGEFDEILPEVVIFTEGLCPRTRPRSESINDKSYLLIRIPCLYNVNIKL